MSDLNATTAVPMCSNCGEFLEKAPIALTIADRHRAEARWDESVGAYRIHELDDGEGDTQLVDATTEGWENKLTCPCGVTFTLMIGLIDPAPPETHGEGPNLLVMSPI